MRSEQIKILLDGISQEVDVIRYDIKDKEIFEETYIKWLEMNRSIRVYGGRSINFPFEIAEALCCIEFNLVKMNSNRINFDCYDIQNNKRIEVKVKLGESDLISFSPNPSFDFVYFMDFYRNGEWDGRFDVYMIPFELLLEHKMNSRDSFGNQINQGRRPRLSLSKIITQYRINPIKTGSIY